jgi:integral membrane sensor domain MASE1
MVPRGHGRCGIRVSLLVFGVRLFPTAIAVVAFNTPYTNRQWWVIALEFLLGIGLMSVALVLQFKERRLAQTTAV